MPPVLGCRYDTLVAGGGDGTLNELVVALLQHKAPQHITVAQLPLGTANDLASAAGISLVSSGAVQAATAGRLLLQFMSPTVASESSMLLAKHLASASLYSTAGSGRA